MKKTEWFKSKALIALVLIGLALRLSWVTLVPTNQLFDFETYQQLAVNVATGHGYTLGGYPVAWQGMIYSVGLGFIYRILGSTSEMIPKIINVIMSEATVIFVYLIMKKIYDKPWAVWTSVIFMTFMPHQITYCNVIGTEILTAFLWSAAIFVSLVELDERRKYVLLGILCALLALSKPFFLAYPLVLAAANYMMKHNLKKSAIQFLVVYSVMMLTIMPWSIRNYKKYDRWIPISYNSGFNLYINNNAQNVHGGWMDYNQIEKPEELAREIQIEVEAHGSSVKTSPNLEVILKPHAMKYIRENPVEFFKLGVIRVHSTYFNGSWDIDAWTMNELTEKIGDESFEYRRTRNFFRAISDILLSIIVGFGIVYVFMNILRMLIALFNPKMNLIAYVVVPVINLAFASLVFFVYEGQPRYNFITLFLLIITFSIGFDIIRNKFSDDAFKISDI